MMCLRKNATAVVATAVLMLGAAACGGGNEPEADPTPIPTTSPTQSTSPTDPPGGPPEGWEDKFTRDQLNIYNAALGRWERYTELANEIYRKGKDTPEARAVLREYNLFWQRDIVTLAQVYDEAGTREERPPEPLWTYARSIKPTQVVIIQCTNYSEVRITRNGEVIDNKPKHLVTPLVIQMTKPKGRDWMFEGSTLKDKASCAG